MTDANLPNRISAIYNNCTVDEQHYLLQILNELSTYGKSDTYNTLWLQDYKEIPVDLDTFLCDNLYLGNVTRQGTAIYPYWKTALHDIFDAGNKYQECVFTGATRIGKTSTAITAAIYMLYRLMCLRDPQAFFGKKDVSQFSILFFNVTLDLAKGVAFREFNDTLRRSPWFNNHGTFSKSERNYYYIPEDGKIVIDYGSEASHGLGKQVFCGFIDEVNFAKAGVKDINKAKQRVKEVYDTIVARVQGTFRQHGEVFGKVFAVSSKKSDSDFMEEHVQSQLSAGNSHMIVFDKPQWEVLPPSMFSPQRFHIAVGDRHRKGFVVDDESVESLNELRNQGYKLLEIPIDMKTNFLADFDISLRDLAGIAVPGTLSFITQSTLDPCVGIRKNPFYNTILEIGTKDSYTIEEFFHLDAVDPQLFRCPMYIDFDLSLNDDKTGMSGVCLSGRKEIAQADGTVLSLPSFSHVFSAAIKAPRGDKIPYAKILAFATWLRHVGFNIELFSRDQFQSEYLAQLLEAQGFKVNKLSVDRTPDGYEALRSVFLEQRIDLLNVPELETELIRLQRDSLTGKIDHPVGGSKDIADSLARSVWNAILNTENAVTVDRLKISNAIAAINGSNLGHSKGSQFPGMFTNYKKF